MLPVDDCSAAADFHNTWVYRLSTTVQGGTAEIIYKVVQGNRAPLSAIRIAKDGQVVEASARDCIMHVVHPSVRPYVHLPV